MKFQDDNLERFDSSGATPLPADAGTGRVANEGASIWYAGFGAFYLLLSAIWLVISACRRKRA